MKPPLHIVSRLAYTFIFSVISFTVYPQSNYTVSFDGTDDYINIADNNALDLSSNFTLEAWIYPTGTGSQPTEGGVILNKENSYEIARFADGTIRFALSANGAGSDWGWNNTGITAPLNQWSHIAIVKSGTSVTSYLNGVAAGTVGSQPATLTANIQVLRIGGRTNVSHYFNGSIDEVRAWNTVRTQAEIKANMFNKNLSMSASGLIAYYRMNSGSSTTATNSCTNVPGIDGTLTNGPAWTGSPIQSGGNALHFDQVNDRVLASLPTTAISNVTMEAWVHHEGGTGTDHLIMVNGVMGSNGYALFINTLHKLCVQFNGVNTWNTGVNLSANQWTHLALVINTTGFIVYKNGVNVYSNTGIPITPTTNFIIGFNTVANGQPFDGMTDEVRIWNTARTQTEIQNNMNSEVDPSASGLALYYTFNQGIAAGTNTGVTTLIDHTGNNNGILTNFSLSGASSNFVAQNISLKVLPVQWLSFEARKQAAGVQLDWSTAQEVNTTHFTVQHKIVNSGWTDLSTTAAAGNSNTTHYYSYLHTDPAAGMNYYRIRQNDADGKSSYSKERSVNIKDEKKVFAVTGNPVENGRLKIEFTQSTNEPFLFYSNDGKLLWKKQLGPGIATVDVSGLNGVYFLQCNGQVEKIVIK